MSRADAAGAVGRRPAAGRAARKMLGRDDWIAAARLMLIESGVDGVKVDLISRALKVTRGSFYWHFRDRADLLDALLADWEETNDGPMVAAFRAAGANGDRADFDRMISPLWIEEKGYSPAYDSAMRDWGRTDPKVAEAVKRSDAARITALAETFGAYGFAEPEATVRARVTYYHQVGYYLLGVYETREERERLGPVFDHVLLY